MQANVGANETYDADVNEIIFHLLYEPPFKKKTLPSRITIHEPDQVTCYDADEEDTFEHTAGKTSDVEHILSNEWERNQQILILVVLTGPLNENIFFY